MSLTIPPDELTELLALPTLAEQSARLQAHPLGLPSALDALLDAAEQLAGADPERSLQLAQLVEQLTVHQPPTPLLPRAHYLQAQIQAVMGHLPVAEALVFTARQGYEQLGLEVEALRTTVGLMRVLGETGRYAEALAAAHHALTRIGASLADTGTEPEAYRAVAARIFQNCGYCLEQTGRYDEALHAYDAAERRYAELGMVQEQSHVLENRGLVLMALGQVQAGLTTFEQALAVQTAAPQPFYEAQTLINLGEAHLLLGHYLPSLHAFAQAAHRLEALGETVDRYILLRQLGDAYLVLNLYAEAEDAYRRAAAGLKAAGVTLHEALTAWGLGAVLSARGRLAEAEQQMAEAARHFARLENRPLQCAVLLEESRLAEHYGAFAQARTLAQQALDLVTPGSWTVQQSYACLRLADLAYPALPQVERLLSQAQPLVDALHLPHLRYRLQGRWGRLRLRQGDVAAAERQLTAAIHEIEQLRASLIHERLRASFLHDKLDAYQDLVQLYLDRAASDGVRTAFAVAEQARSRALVDLMAGVMQNTPAPELHTPERQAQEAVQAELNAVYSAILGSPDQGRTDSTTLPRLQERAAQLEQTLSQLQLRQQLANGADGQRPSAAPPVRKETSAGAFPQVVYYMLGEEVLAFVCQNEQIRLLRQLTTVTRVGELAQRLAAQWARLRLPTPLLELHQKQLIHTTQRLLHHLYDELMAPVLALLEADAHAGPLSELVIVPHGLLHQLPFHAFFDGEWYLVERLSISYAPSATVFALCQARQPRPAGQALILAVPDAQIPAAAHEAAAVAERLQEREVQVQCLIAEAATRTALRQAADGVQILHLSCHGLFRQDTPMFSALKLADGWITAAELAQLDLGGALVTLSACESGRSQVLGGDEILGLTSAVLSAGAATLIVSQWLVPDQATAELMAECYRALDQGQDLALALRTAQRHTLRHYPHPYYWASFILVGRRTLA
jgi:CHAT domain-containing protein